MALTILLQLNRDNARLFSTEGLAEYQFFSLICMHCNKKVGAMSHRLHPPPCKKSCGRPWRGHSRLSVIWLSVLITVSDALISEHNGLSQFNEDTGKPSLPAKNLITGSAVALHCCKAHAKTNKKMENSTPCKIVTPKNFILKLCIRDYVGEVTRHANFRFNRSSGGFSPNRRNITSLWLFLTVLSCPVLTFFFSILCPGRTAGPIFTFDGWNDVFPRKDGPFGG